MLRQHVFVDLPKRVAPLLFLGCTINTIIYATTVLVLYVSQHTPNILRLSRGASIKHAHLAAPIEAAGRLWCTAGVLCVAGKSSSSIGGCSVVARARYYYSG